jgi:hypothetical protein
MAMEMMVRSMEMAEKAMKTNGDGSEGTSLSRNKDLCPSKFVVGGGGAAELFLEICRLF